MSESVNENLLCQECNKALLTEGLTAGQQVRCSNCFHTFKYGREIKGAADQLAWRSLWLGLASFLLCSLTGLPALYYGTRSLLRMRFNKTAVSDRVAALVGTGLGITNGLIGGLVVVFGLVLAAFTWQNFDTGTSADKVDRIYEEIFLNDLPPNLVGSKVIRVGGFTELEFVYVRGRRFDPDGDENATQNVKLLVRSQTRASSSVVIQLGIPLDRMMVNQYQDLLEDKETVRTNDNKKLLWKVLGKETPINQSILKNPRIPTGQQIIQYDCRVATRGGTLEIGLVVLDPDPYFSQTKIQEIFESFRLRDPPNAQ